MATVTSIKNGGWYDTTTWDTGIVPVLNDKVVIAHPGTAISRTTDSATYAIGATSISVIAGTGTIMANESVQFGTDPTYYSITTGVTASAGTLVISPALVQAVTPSTIVYTRGHVVTMGGTYVGGDDTASGVTVLGTLRASRTTSSQLTVRGDLFISANGTLDYGFEADPIPSTITAVIVCNDSATMAHNKWGVRTDATIEWAGFRMWGAYKNAMTSLVSSASATDTVLTVGDATGWQVNDWVVFENSTAANTSANGSVQRRVISAISGNQVTISSSLGLISQAGRKLINVTRNVRVIGASPTTYRTQVLVAFRQQFATQNALELGNCEFRLTGGSTLVQYNSGLNIVWQSGNTSVGIIKSFKNVSMHDYQSVSASGTVTIMASGVSLLSVFGNQLYKFTVDSPLFSSANQMCAMTFYSGSSTIVKNTTAICLGLIWSSGYSQGGVDCILDGGTVSGLGTHLFSGSGVAITMQNMTVDGIYRYQSASTIAFGSLNVKNCIFGQNLGVYQPLTPYAFYAAQYSPLVFDGCTYPVIPNVGGSRGSNNLNLVGSGAYLKLRNCNNDPTQQYYYTNGGQVSRDNTTFYRGKSSLRFDCWYSGNPISYNRQVQVAANQTITVVGYIQFNSTYGSTTMPSVTISGLNATPVTFTASNSANTWQKFSLTITNPNSYAGEFTLSTTGASTANATGAYYWLDGIPFSDYVDTVKHYGYLYDLNVYRTVDPIVQLPESSASALTGISFASNTLTISGTRSIREVYDWMKWYECSNGSNSAIMTSTDGTNFTLNSNLTITGLLTGSGNISIGSNTLVCSGDTDVIITSSAGTRVKIKAPNLLSGSRVQIYNVTSSTELYNAVTSSTGVSIPVIYNTADTIRLRAAFTGYYPTSNSGSLSAVGLTFTNVQVADSIYTTNGISGASVTEFSANLVSNQISIVTGGNTSPQRLYAWYQNYLISSSGIASSFFGSITANDTINYVIDQSVSNIFLNNTTTNVSNMVGGVLTRADSSSVIASGSYAIQINPGKSYFATNSIDNTAIASAVRAAIATELARIDVANSTRLAASSYVNPPDVTSISSQVRINLAPELARIDTNIGSRLASSSYVVPDSSSTIASAVWNNSIRSLTINPGLTTAQEAKLDIIGAKTSNLPSDPASNTVVNTRLASGSYVVPDSATTIASAVRTNLTTELARIDTNIGSRLASADYLPFSIDTNAISSAVWSNSIRSLTVNPGLTTAQEAKLDGVKSKTDNLPSDPASNTVVNTRLASSDFIIPTVDLTNIPNSVWGYNNRTLTVASGLTIEQESKIDAINSKTSNLPSDPASNTVVNTRLASSSYVVPVIPTSVDISNAVWTNTDRTLTVASGLTVEQESKIDQIETKVNSIPTDIAKETTQLQIQTKIDSIT